MFVNEVFIRGYRGVKELEFEANRISVIVGPNNTGKSSILETIGLATTVSSKFEDLFGSSLLEYLLERRGYDPKYLIHTDEDSANVEVKVQGKEYRLVLEYSRGLPRDVRGLLIENYFGEELLKIIENITRTGSKEFYIKLKEALEDFATSMIRKFDLNPGEVENLQNRILRRYGLSEKPAEISSESFNLIKERIIDEVTRTSKLIISVENPFDELLGLYVYISKDIRRWVMRIIARDLKLIRTRELLLLSPVFEGEWKLYTVSDAKIKPEIKTIFGFWRNLFRIRSGDLYDMAVHEGKIEELLEFVRECVPYIRDIRKTEKGIQVMTDAKKPIPMSSMGDGFTALFKLSFLMSLVDRGIVLLEEPEISLHPYFMNVIIHRILRSSENVQFFISTHSFDFLRTLLEEAYEQNLLDRINVIRMQRREDLGGIISYPMSGETAREELEEIGIDLRYT